jgi:hypothetical protein
MKAVFRDADIERDRQGTPTNAIDRLAVRMPRRMTSDRVGFRTFDASLRRNRSGWLAPSLPVMQALKAFGPLIFTSPDAVTANTK